MTWTIHDLIRERRELHALGKTNDVTIVDIGEHARDHDAELLGALEAALKVVEAARRHFKEPFSGLEAALAEFDAKVKT